MKIREIVLEDDDYLGQLWGKSDNTTAPEKGDEQKPDSEKTIVDKAKDVSNQVTGFLPDIGLNYATLALGGAALVGTGYAVNKAGEGFTKLTAAGLSKLSSEYARKFKLSARVERMWMTKYGPWGKLFSFIGLAAAITQLYSNLYVLEAMYVQNKIDFNKLEEQREFEFGVFETQLLAPALVKLISRVIGVTSAVKWFIRIVGGVSVGASLGTSIAATLASEAFIRWFQHWLGTDQGREVLYNYLGGIIRTIGKPVDSLWDRVFKYYNKTDVKKYGSQEKADAAQAERKEKKDAEADVFGRSAKTKEVDGITVTDNQGFLLPSNALIANARLQLMRKQAVDAGKPDPLAGFPLKPGNKLPPII